jgi:hypothetical protein
MLAAIVKDGASCDGTWNGQRPCAAPLPKIAWSFCPCPQQLLMRPSRLSSTRLAMCMPRTAEWPCHLQPQQSTCWPQCCMPTSLTCDPNMAGHLWYTCSPCALPCPALPCPALPCPALPCPALPCPALPCPAWGNAWSPRSAPQAWSRARWSRIASNPGPRCLPGANTWLLPAKGPAPACPHQTTRNVRQCAGTSTPGWQQVWSLAQPAASAVRPTLPCPEAQCDPCHGPV